MQQFYLGKTPDPQPIHLSSAKPNGLDYAIAGLVLAVPILCAVGFWTHRKRRASMLQQQVAKLERIWQLKSSKRR